MFTILWEIDQRRSELYVAPGVSKIPAEDVPSQDSDCGGREHIAFQRLDGYGLCRTVIDVGTVYVMNSEGKTVATYRFPATATSRA